MTTTPTPKRTPAETLQAFLERERHMTLMRLAELDRLLGREPTVAPKHERERRAFQTRRSSEEERYTHE